jgi:hypothetical protein
VRFFGDESEVFAAVIMKSAVTPFSPIVLVVVVFVFTLVLAVVVNRTCSVFIVERCPFLLCFVYCVLFECVVTLCMCYLSVVSYWCSAATGLKPNCS